MVPVSGRLLLESVRRVTPPLETGLVCGDKEPEVVQWMLLVAGATPSAMAHVEWGPAVQPKIGAK